MEQSARFLIDIHHKITRDAVLLDVFLAENLLPELWHGEHDDEGDDDEHHKRHHNSHDEHCVVVTV